MPRGSSRAGIGFALLAIALWSSLAAVAGRALDDVRVFTLLAPSLLIGGITLLGVDLARGRGWRAPLGGPPRALALGLWGIFGYHSFLYGALACSPGTRVGVNLVNYLWPLCLVVFAGFVEGGFRRKAVLGTLLGLAGAALAITGQGPVAWTGVAGPALALGAAVTWGGFSVLLPRTAGAHGRMAGWCCWSGLLAAVLALAVGPGPWPDGAAWGAIVYLGVGPLGIAFTAWEAALQRTSGQVVGALAYLAPPASTVLLAWREGEPLGWPIGVALALVVGGAALGAGARRRATPSLAAPAAPAA